MKNNNIHQAKWSLKIWLSYLEKLHDKPIDMTIERVNEVAVYLDVLKPASFIFTVAGTNGKGSTCRVLETILMAKGYKVGVYSSPHLVQYTERVRIQNTQLPEVLHTISFSEIETVRRNISLTYFEYSTLSALWLFKQAKLDVVILEVGLGGRLDATNIIDTDVAIITNIALDHTDWLGLDRESIGREKAGIFRNKKPAIVGEIDIPKSILEVTKEKKAKLYCRGVDWNFFEMKNTWHFKDKYGDLKNLPFSNNISQSNAATALAALRTSMLDVNEKVICEGLRQAVLPGRFQIINESPRLVLDVAHNPHAAKYLLKNLKSIIKKGRVLAVTAMLYDKDIAGTLSCMEEIVNKWYFASLKEKRGANAQYLMNYIGKGMCYKSVTEAWYAAMNEANLDDTVLVFGSFYTVAHIIEAINLRKINKKI